MNSRKLRVQRFDWYRLYYNPINIKKVMSFTKMVGLTVGKGGTFQDRFPLILILFGGTRNDISVPPKEN